MNILLTILLCFGVVLAQATLTPLLTVRGIHPDFCFILACVAGFLYGEYRGLLIGLTVGVFQDLLAPGGIGLNMILKGIAGTLAGMTTHTISTVTGPAVLLVTLALSLGCGLASLMVAFPVVDASVLLQAFAGVLLPQGMYHSLLALGVFWITRKTSASMSMVDFARRRR